jgi:hypothetical protein
MTAYAPPPKAVVRALASLDTGGLTSHAAVNGWLTKLPQEPEATVRAIWVLVIVCRIETCQACAVLRLNDCLRCWARVKGIPVEDDELRLLCDLVMETVQLDNRRQARARRR